VNILFTTTNDFLSFESQEHLSTWRKACHIVERLPFERITSYLLFDPASSLALVDAIVCAADDDLIMVPLDGSEPTLSFPLTRALMLAEDVRSLPESCAMRDGRKWRSIPFVILSRPGSYELRPDTRENTHAHILMHHHPILSIRQIQGIVEEYQDRVLEDYRNVGIMIRFKNGRAQVAPAMRRRDPGIESEYYYAAGDRRTNTTWVTVKRDNEGLRHDVELFQHLIDAGANETQMHRFFEEHPAILMEARMGIPISHRPNFAKPKDWKPDFAFSPILGPHNGNTVELMELKGPGERTLSGGDHRGFSAKVKAAVDQVRDYARCLRDPINFRVIEEAFGYIPKESNLAVLIGRVPANDAEREVFERRQSELNVKIITYDEILQTQASQIKHVNLSYFFR